MRRGGKAAQPREDEPVMNRRGRRHNPEKTNLVRREDNTTENEDEPDEKRGGRQHKRERRRRVS